MCQPLPPGDSPTAVNNNNNNYYYYYYYYLQTNPRSQIKWTETAVIWSRSSQLTFTIILPSPTKLFNHRSQNSLLIPYEISLAMFEKYYGFFFSGMQWMWFSSRSFATCIGLLIIRPTRCANFSNLFRNEILHVSDSSSVHHQELFTVHSAVVYVIEFCRQASTRIRMEDLPESCLKTCMTYTIAECTVNNSWWWTEELSGTCRVSFQNKFDKLVHLFGFIIRGFHDARSHERKIVSVCSHQNYVPHQVQCFHCMSSLLHSREW
jgi:hypothetical protein